MTEVGTSDKNYCIAYKNGCVKGGEAKMSTRPEKRKVEFIESYWTGGVYGSDYIWNDNHGELVRCKDCRYVDYMDSYKRYQCPKNKRFVEDDWFCGDGKRR